MPFDAKGLKAVIFDYGNTLVEFGARQILFCDMALAAALEKHFGTPDVEKLKAIRNRDRMAPYTGTGDKQYRENDLVEISTQMVRELYGCEPSPEQLADLLRTRFDVFQRVVKAADTLPPLLARLKKKYKLGIVSNYPDGDAIRRSLEANALDRFFNAVVVSGDLGVVKPHPQPFLTVLDRLRVKPSEAVLVGDNWLADVQGGLQAGLRVIHVRQWDCPEDMPRRETDRQPHAVIRSLAELEQLL